MSKRTIGASIAIALLSIVLIVKWQSQRTVFSYLVPAELMGSTVYLDGRKIGVVSQPLLEFKVSKTRHTLKLVKTGQQPTNIEVDLSGQQITRRQVP